MAIPVLVAAVLLTAVTLVLIFAELSRSARTALLAVDATLWLFFAVDYVVRLVLTPTKRKFLRTEWLDLVLVVLPFLQPFRVVGALVRLARMSAAIDRAGRGAGLLMRQHKLYLAFAWAGGLVLVASIVTPIVEPDSSKIKTFGDGTWWALVTTTTVGYGDLVPESAAGKCIGAALMLVGISMIGVVSANIAAMFIEPGPDTESTEQETADPLPTLQERLDVIEEKLDMLIRQRGGELQ